MTTTDQHPVTVALSKQLEVATDINAYFCIGCGQPDEPELHDPARCPAREGGKLDVLTVADALEVYDTSCDEEPDLDGDARALHCAIVATRLASVSSASAERRPDGRAVPGDARTINGDLHFYRAAGWYPAPTPEPVPATNQAGEVEGAIRIAVWNACRDRGMGQDNATMLVREVLAQPVLTAALATQPATSQEGAFPVGYTNPALLARAKSNPLDTGCASVELYRYPAGDYCMPLFAATPTPPTLSEDLESALTDLVSWFSESGPSEYGPWIIVAGEHGADAAVVEARAALARAQVKAS
jgi:hypothetical protein